MLVVNSVFDTSIHLLTITYQSLDLILRVIISYLFFFQSYIMFPILIYRKNCRWQGQVLLLKNIYKDLQREFMFKI